MPATTATRTQAERRAATQSALIDATLTCLVDRGHAGTTTTEICSRAGVSQGALFRYHDTKADLLVAAVEALFDRLYDTFRAGMEDIAEADDRIAAAVQILWDLYRRPDLLAALELYVAARTDDELRAALLRLEAPHEERTLALAEELFPEAAATQPNFRLGVTLVIDTLQGAAVRGVALADHAGIERELDLLTDLARAVLTATETDRRRGARPSRGRVSTHGRRK